MASFLVGGVYGDLKEYGNNVAQCVCCLMCTGPILIIIGMAVFSSSFSDYRLQQINEYDAAVSTWNSGPGADNTFQDLNIIASVAAVATTFSAATETLMGVPAPEPIGDKSLRAEEKFATVQNPYYYKNMETVSILKSDWSKQHSLKFRGDNVKPGSSSSSSSTDAVLFDPVINVNLPYSWYVPRSSSKGSSSIDCKNPNYGKIFVFRVIFPNQAWISSMCTALPTLALLYFFN